MMKTAVAALIVRERKRPQETMVSGTAKRKKNVKKVKLIEKYQVALIKKLKKLQEQKIRINKDLKGK